MTLAVSREGYSSSASSSSSDSIFCITAYGALFFAKRKVNDHTFYRIFKKHDVRLSFMLENDFAANGPFSTYRDVHN